MMRRVLIPGTVSPLVPASGSVLHELRGDSMGSTWSARVLAGPGTGPALRAQLQQQLDQVVAQMSHWEAGSDLGRYNSAPAGSWHQLPSEFFTVLDYALALAERSGGAYDPCAGALVNAWGFGAVRRYNQNDFYAPAAPLLQALLARGDRQRIQFDRDGKRLLQPGGVQLDLSSVAKGFAVDQMARCLDGQGLHHYLVEAGGELRGAGVKPDGLPWFVELEGVPDATPSTPTVVALHGLALATSGDYRRYFEHGGQRASHTIDPRTGYPIANAVASVSVIHPHCMAADALSTVLTVLGPEHGLRLAEQLELAARFLVRRDGALEEITTSAFRTMLQ